MKSPNGLEILRHSTSHVMACAVQELFPEVKVTIGPAIENGFYYDFDRETAFTPDDLALIEKRMKEIVSRDEPFERLQLPTRRGAGAFPGEGRELQARAPG